MTTAAKGSDEIAALDATAQADLVRRREVSPTELVDAAIARAERLQPVLNCFTTTRFDRARAEAEATNPDAGPFAGVPTAMKITRARRTASAMSVVKVRRPPSWFRRTMGSRPGS